MRWTSSLPGQASHVVQAAEIWPLRLALYCLMYTSGTTAHPKGVTHTYDNYDWQCLDHIATLGLSAADRLLGIGPLYHVGAFDVPGLALFIVGGTLCVMRDFDPEATLTDLASFRWLIGGGERMPEQRMHEFTSLFRQGRYLDAYGLRETCAGDTLMEAGREIDKIGSTMVLVVWRKYATMSVPRSTERWFIQESIHAASRQRSRDYRWGIGVGSRDSTGICQCWSAGGLVGSQCGRWASAGGRVG